MGRVKTLTVHRPERRHFKLGHARDLLAVAVIDASGTRVTAIDGGAE